MNKNISPIAVIGPTATGKSELALELALRAGGQIINCDAMQLYRGMDIGTAKLPPEERQGIIHHQLDVLEVTETATVASYQEAARADIEELLNKNIQPIIVGGSMMYIQALLDDWQFPATDPEVRARYETELLELGVGALHQKLAAIDKLASENILSTDSRRIVRALEVVEITGKPFAASAPKISQPRWGTTIVALDRDSDELDQRIKQRTAQMYASGFVTEVHELLACGLREGVTASRAIGYAQVIAHISGELTVEEAEELTFIGTRRYVRRQRSWFRRDPRVQWLQANDSITAAVLADMVLH